MGYQESYIQFPNFEILAKEIKKYKKRDTSDDLARVIGTVQVLQDFQAFKQDEICLVTAGERSEQRSPKDLKDGLGLTGVASYRSIHFIDDLFYDDNDQYDETFKLDDYFKFKPL